MASAMSHVDYWRAHAVLSAVLAGDYCGPREVVRDAGRVLGLARDYRSWAARWELGYCDTAPQCWGSTRDIEIAGAALYGALKAWRRGVACDLVRGPMIRALHWAVIACAAACDAWYDSVGVDHG